MEHVQNQPIPQMNIHSTEIYNQPMQQICMYETMNTQPLGTQNQSIQQVFIHETQQQLLDNLNDIMEEIDIEINEVTPQDLSNDLKGIQQKK